MSGVVLLTAFDPFGGAEANPSAELLAALCERRDARLRTAILPTSYRRSEAMLEALIAEHRPRCILMLGYRRVERLQLERWARNRDDPAALDNDAVAGSAPIVAGGRRLLRARGRLRALRSQLRQSGVPVEISRNAGGFVCNHAYYSALAAVGRSRDVDTCLFVHVGDWQRSCERDGIVLGARLLLEHCLARASS